MKRIIFLFIIICSALKINAQVFETLHSDNYLKVLQDTNSEALLCPFIYSDKNNDAFHLMYGGYLVTDTMYSLQVDNNLNVVERIKLRDSMMFRSVYFNSKIYSCGIETSNNNIESVFFKTYDSAGSVLSIDTIIRKTDDTIKWDFTSSKFLCLEDKSMMFLIIGNRNYNSQTHATPENIKMIKFDSLGNILKSKIIYSPIGGYDICEMPNHIMFFISEVELPYELQEKSKIYYLNKENLEPMDSIMGFYPTNMTKVNDTLIVFHSPLIIFDNDTISDISILNINTKQYFNTPIRYNRDGFSVFMSFYESGKDAKVIDYKTIDSIYACYLVRNEFYSYCAIEICNFNIYGDTNFVYRINLRTGGYKAVRGIKATQDGGLLVVASSLDNGFSGFKDVWLIKFHPKGLINLTNIETGEKETIKVYPNPAKDFVYVDIEATNFKKGEIELFDMQGKLVKKAKLSAKHRNRVDVSNLNGGAYTYNVSLNGKTISGKVIVGK